MPRPRTSSTSSTSPTRAARSTRTSPSCSSAGCATGRSTAEQAMTPRVACDTVHGRRHAAASSTSCAPAASRFPVVAEDVDDIVGVVGMAEVLDVPRDRWGSDAVRDACPRRSSCPGRCRCPPPWSRSGPTGASWPSSSTSSAGSTGVLSLEDIAEEVVGDIFDEGDEREPEPPAGPADTRYPLGPASARRGGGRRPASALPLGADYATVSGLVLGRLGRVARLGDTVVVDEVVEPGDLDDLSVPDRIEIRVDEVERHVPAVVTLLRLRSDRRRRGAGLMNVAVSIGLSVLLLLANAFFVAAEFAVVSAKRHRLEVAAAFGGRSARAAVRNSRELSLGLAGAQLGITLRDAGARRARQAGGRRPARPAAPADPVAGGHGLGHRHGHRRRRSWCSSTWSSARWRRSRGRSVTPSGRRSCSDCRSACSWRRPDGSFGCSTASPTPCSGSGGSSRSMRPASCRGRPSCGCSSTHPGSTASSRPRRRSCSAASSTWPARRCMRRRCPSPTS